MSDTTNLVKKRKNVPLITLRSRPSKSSSSLDNSTNTNSRTISEVNLFILAFKKNQWLAFDSIGVILIEIKGINETVLLYH